MRNTVLIILVTAVILLFVYCGYWVAKTVSYNIFYKDMVKRTVIEMVKETSLKEKN